MQESVTAQGKQRAKTLLIFSQTYVPDPASVGQHIADVAVEMARRGYRVRVYTSARGYEDPTVRYPRRQTLDGVEVRRLPFGSFGKKSMLLRVLGTAVFQLECLAVGLSSFKMDGIFFGTSPPLVGAIASALNFVRRAPIAYWAMDLNPDQLIALGKLKKTSLTARVLESVNRLILRRSALIVALDRFMAERLQSRMPARQKMLVMPPWPHENFIESADPAGAPSPGNPFRQRHGLDGKFVIMYSGNHSPANPLSTLLQAAVLLKDDADIRFLFVGGGSGKKEVDAAIAEHGLVNVLSLPYQPLAELKYSLSAADVHVVSLGQEMVGIIHPCKIYGAMAVGRPILYFGPSPSHITDLVESHGFGLRVAHGDVAGAVQAIMRFKQMSANEIQSLGDAAQAALRQNLSQAMLCGRLCDHLEHALFNASIAADDAGRRVAPIAEE